MMILIEKLEVRAACEARCETGVKRHLSSFGFLALSAFITPIRVSIVGPSCSVTSIRASIAVCHSTAGQRDWIVKLTPRSVIWHKPMSILTGGKSGCVSTPHLPHSEQMNLGSRYRHV
jgi:hypothetical protein